ncbi:hypothetical protein D0Y65_031673 [Glycine soja]|uniref:Lysine ketoglutarate reductase trans-splicing-like protein n=1 Tax=Glycine soja TaxID=3848 RepID=A0A445I9E8_GLYSO|nr:hypothetical protein D0Y65_031673 [Glycine soja]
MTSIKSLRWLMRKKSGLSDGGKSSFKMKQLPFLAVLCTIMLFIVYRTTKYQYHQEEVYPSTSGKLKGLPRGIIHDNSDLELRPLWSRSNSRSKAVYSNSNLLAVPVGIKQKQNVDAMVQKFLRENFTIILFHYDGNVDGWWNLDWSSKAIHIVARNQTKWWFAKRFLHPDIVSIYDYIFLWDEDLGVEHFSPSRYVEIIKREGLEISQPALDPNSTEIHHKITIRARTKKFHRRVYERRGSTRCSDLSEGPPCTGFVEGMAPVFSRSAWYCTWHLIQVILLPWFLGILNVSSNYMLKNPFKLFQILCFFQLYYCGTYCGQLQFFVQSFIIVFFSRVSFSSYQKCWQNTNRFSEMRFAFVWLLKTNFSDSLDSLAFCFGRLPEFLVKFDLVFMKFLEIIFLYIK